MAPICATDIQRVFRGYCGRLDAKVKRRLIQAAVSMVSYFLCLSLTERFLCS